MSSSKYGDLIKKAREPENQKASKPDDQKTSEPETTQAPIPHPQLSHALLRVGGGG